MSNERVPSPRRVLVMESPATPSDGFVEPSTSSEDLMTILSQRVLGQFVREKARLESEIRERYEAQYEAKRRNLKASFALQREQLEADLDAKLAHLLEQRRLEDESRLKEKEKEYMMEYLSRIEASDAKWQDELERHKKLFEDALTAKDVSHREDLLRLAQEHDSDVLSSRDAYEDEIRKKYDKVLQENTDRASEILLEGQKKVEDERIRLKQEMMEFERVLHQKYAEQLDEKDQSVRAQLTSQSNHFMARQAQQESERTESLRNREEEFEEEKLRIRDHFQAQLDLVRQEERGQIEQSGQSLAQVEVERDEIAQRCTALELQISRMKQNLDQWKLTYHKNTMSNFKRLIFEVELNAKRDMEDFARKQIQDYENHLLLELKQKDQELRLYEQREKDFKDHMIESQRARRQEDVSYRSKEEGFRRLQQSRVRIAELWDALEVPPEERFRFVWNCHSFNHFTTDTLLYFDNEIDRLAEKLPLLETIKRREALKRTIRRMFRSQGGKIDEVKLDGLTDELKSLSEVLLTNLPTYERKYNEVVSYEGQSYLQVMNQENRYFSS